MDVCFECVIWRNDLFCNELVLWKLTPPPVILSSCCNQFWRICFLPVAVLCKYCGAFFEILCTLVITIFLAFYIQLVLCKLGYYMKVGNNFKQTIMYMIIIIVCLCKLNIFLGNTESCLVIRMNYSVKIVDRKTCYNLKHFC